MLFFLSFKHFSNKYNITTMTKEKLKLYFYKMRGFAIETPKSRLQIKPKCLG